MYEKIFLPGRSLFFLIILGMLVSCKAASHSTSFKNTLFRAYDHTPLNAYAGIIEGPAVDHLGRLFVLNYQYTGSVGLVKNNGSIELFLQLPGKSTGSNLLFNRSGEMLITDIAGRNILVVNMQSRRVLIFAHNDSIIQPDEMCINKKGQLFVTDRGENGQNGKIWRINENGTSALLKDGLGTATGICMSPDGTTLYVNDSTQRKVWAFSVDDGGALANQRVFASFTDFGLDGMKCDYKGNVYVTRPGKGAIAIFNTQGIQVQEVALKGRQVSNLDFGGTDFKTCFVTFRDRKAIEKFRTDVPGK